MLRRSALSSRSPFRIGALLTAAVFSSVVASRPLIPDVCPRPFSSSSFFSCPISCSSTSSASSSLSGVTATSPLAPISTTSPSTVTAAPAAAPAAPAPPAAPASSTSRSRSSPSVASRAASRSMSSSSSSAAAAAPAEPALMKTATVIPPKGDHKFTVVWLHGLGDQGSSFVDVFDMLSLPKGTKVILPNAPIQPVTCNGGYKMPAWFDIYVLGNKREFTGKQDDEGTLKSAAAISEIIDAEAAALGSAKRVFIGGFSQGGAMTMHVGLGYKEKLGGLVVCSGYYPLSYNEDKYLVQKTGVPLLMYHGASDPIVPLHYARMSKEFLEKHGVSFTNYVEEPGLQHSLSPRELPVISAFLKDAMNQATA